jgi:hypothetical protein
MPFWKATCICPDEKEVARVPTPFAHPHARAKRMLKTPMATTVPVAGRASKRGSSSRGTESNGERD